MIYPMQQPIQRDHESCCPNCGCVLGTTDEFYSEVRQRSTLPISFDVILLGSAFERGLKRNPQDVYVERVLLRIDDIVKKFGLPERFTMETFNELKRRKRGFRSENEPIKILIRLLSKDENYIHFPKLQKLKARYEKIINC